MYCRAFHWASCFMIKNLTGLSWESVANFESVTIKKDWRLSDFLRMNTAWPISNNNETFREYVMTFNPSKSLDNPASLDNFLTQASGPLRSTTYVFDSNIAATFHTLLLSSLYYYLCSMTQLKLYSSEKSRDEQKIRVMLGFFAMQLNYFFLCHTPMQWGHTSLLCDSWLTTRILNFLPTTKIKSQLPSVLSYVIWVGSRGKWRLKTQMTMTETRKRII